MNFDWRRDELLLFTEASDILDRTDLSESLLTILFDFFWPPSISILTTWRLIVSLPAKYSEAFEEELQLSDSMIVGIIYS